MSLATEFRQNSAISLAVYTIVQSVATQTLNSQQVAKHLNKNHRRAMEFSFDKHLNSHPMLITAPQLDMFGISQLTGASYEAGGEAAATPGKQKKTKKRRSTSDGKPYPTIKCSECPKTYRDNAAGQRHLELHMTTHDPNAQSKYTCGKCTKTFSNEVYLKRHSNLCGLQRKRKSSIGSSTHDESSNDSLLANSNTPRRKKRVDVDSIAEERPNELPIDFKEF